ncbi:MAG: hypothetical protein AAF702_24340 [Chloroflexota bacterium]
MSESTLTLESDVISSDVADRIQRELDQRLPEMLNGPEIEPVVVEDDGTVEFPQVPERVVLIRFKCKGVIEGYRVQTRFGRTQVIFKLKGKATLFTFPLDGSPGAQSWLDDIKNSQKCQTPICVYINNGGVVEGIGTL